MQGLSPIPIVLTGTITPNGVADAIRDPEIRKAEYLRAIQFYSPFSEKIFFLENSLYPTRREAAFLGNKTLELRELAASAHPERGKGFQEFEMLDAWIATDSPLPERWLKISGRYLIRNIAAILKECDEEKRASLIIDQSVRSRIARTQVFYSTTEAYRNVIQGSYQKCDDRTGCWIERVLFERLKQAPDQSVRFFRHRPRIEGRAGTTGQSYPSSVQGGILKQVLRTANRLFDARYLWFSR